MGTKRRNKEAANREIDTGRALPQDVNGLAQAIACYAQISIDQHRRLIMHLARHVLVDALGEDLAIQCLGPEQLAGDIDAQRIRYAIGDDSGGTRVE